MDKRKRGVGKKSSTQRGGRRAGAVVTVTSTSIRTVLRGQVASPKILKSVFLNSGLRYQRVALSALAADITPKPLPDTFTCRAGSTLQIHYQLEVVVAELDLKWMPDVDGDNEWDGVIDLDHTESASEVTGTIEQIPQGWSLLQWVFTPANLEQWRALLTIDVDGVTHVFEEKSGAESATHHGHLLIEAVPS